MSNNIDLVQKKDEMRYKMLLKLWEATEGNAHKYINYNEVAQQAGLSKVEAQEVYLYFMDEGLFGNRRVDGGVTLSHKAIVEIEESVKNPTVSTEHFSSTIIQHFNAPVGAVQTGAHSTAHVTQHFGSDLSKVMKLVEELRQNVQALPPERRAPAVDLVNGIEEEARSNTPRKARLKAYLNELNSFANDATIQSLATSIAKYLGVE